MHRSLIPLTILLAVTCATAAFAGKPAWVIPDVLNVREKPGTDSAKVGTVQRGDQVIVTAFREDRWCKALLPNGRSGWVKEEYLMFSADKGRELAKSAGKTPMAVPAWVKEPVINMRGGPDIGSKVVCQASRGEKVYIVEKRGDWRKVKRSSGQYGWVRSDLLEYSLDAGRKLSGSSGAAAPKPRPQAAGPKPAWVTANVANVRKGPSLGYTRTGQFTRGTKVYIVEQRGDWANVSGPGGKGWMHTDLLETNLNKGRSLASETGGKDRDKAYCIGNNVALRSGPGTEYKELERLTQGATLWIEDEEDNWCEVEVEGGDSGWIAGWYVRRHGAKNPVAREPGADALKPPAGDFPSPNREPEEGKLQPFSAWIAEDNTNVRSGPGTEHPVKFQLNKQQRVQVTDCEGQWCKITTESGSVGWAAGWVLDFQPPGRPEAAKIVDGRRIEVKAGWVDGNVVNIRAGKGTDSAIVGTAKEGEEVVIVARESGWLKVLLSDGKVGWIAEELIESRAERELNGGQGGSGSVELGGSDMGNKIAQTAMRYLGRPYVRGAEGPGSFDCSGFTQFVHSQFGIPLKRTAGGQYRQGTPVDRDSLRPGDVVVFSNTYKAGISHVGIYIGNGNFVHAANSRSGVRISALDSSYYASRYSGARRMY